MSTTDDWQDARRDLLEEGRRRVGPPPDVEKVEALLRGDLPEAEAQHVREVLAYYPELVQVMTAKETPDAVAMLTDAQSEADHARIRQRLGLDSAPIVGRRPGRQRRMFAVAAGIVIAVAITGAVMMQMDNGEPRPHATRILVADADRGTRGAASVREIRLVSSADYLLKPLYAPSRPYRHYRLELFDLNANAPSSLWIRDDVQRQPDGSFPVQLSSADLDAGRYELVLYGLDGLDGTPERLATYTLRIEKR